MPAHITVGLGFGDEGKGATVDYLCRTFKANLVVRYCGGAQAGHNVVLPDGTRHIFSQFGAGTFAGVRTFLGPAVIIEPLALSKEAEALKKCGVPILSHDPLLLLKIHPSCLVSTPIHQALNHIREKQNNHGTCGLGIGETRHYWLKHGQDAIFAKDLVLRHDDLYDKLELLRQRALLEFPDSTEIREFSPHFWVSECPKLYVADDPGASPKSTIVFEGAQGILIDEYRGCHPHTTWSDVTVRNAAELCNAYGWEIRSVIGCTRTYLTRHGTGPLPNAYPELSCAVEPLADPGNVPNKWQGAIRFAPLDVPLLTHAIDSVGLPLTGLAVSCIDQREGGQVCVCRDNLWENVHPRFETIANIPQFLNNLVPVLIEGRGPTWAQRSMVAAYQAAA